MTNQTKTMITPAMLEQSAAVVLPMMSADEYFHTIAIRVADELERRSEARVAPPEPVAPADPEDLLDAQEVQHLYLRGASRTTLYRMVRDGRFPAPITMPGQWRRWRRSVCDAWLHSLLGKGGDA